MSEIVYPDTRFQLPLPIFGSSRLSRAEPFEGRSIVEYLVPVTKLRLEFLRYSNRKTMFPSIDLRLEFLRNKHGIACLKP